MTAPTSLYRHFDRDGALLYIGISADIGARTQQHSHLQPWWLEVHSITVEHFPTREMATEAEAEAIIAEDPRYNIRGRRRGSTPMTPVQRWGGWLPSVLADHYRRNGCPELAKIAERRALQAWRGEEPEALPEWADDAHVATCTVAEWRRRRS